MQLGTLCSEATLDTLYSGATMCSRAGLWGGDTLCNGATLCSGVNMCSRATLYSGIINLRVGKGRVYGGVGVGRWSRGEGDGHSKL